MVAVVCVLIESVPGPFQTPITIPLQVEEFVPKGYYGYGYPGYGYRKRRDISSDRVVRVDRSTTDGTDYGIKHNVPAGQLNC